MQLDAGLGTLALSNLLDNAARYACADSPITVEVEGGSGALPCRVINHGPGLPPHEHIPRSANFARGRGEEVRLMVMAHLPVGVSAPLDHVRSTFQLAMLQPGVVALTLNVVPEQLNDASEQALSSMQFSHASRSSAKPVTVAARFSQRARHVLWSYCEAKQSA